ncbi:hypothetical protein ACLB1G_03785 [Oxalobacteraceae bacterium A2-2]
MRIKTALLLAAALACGRAAACEPVRFGYPDQHRPPYWLGNGHEVPASHPGAGVELLRRFAASAGCSAEFVRLPVLRLRAMLAAGEIDFLPLDTSAQDTPGVVFPRTGNGSPDPERATPMLVVVWCGRPTVSGRTPTRCHSSRTTLSD